MTPTLVFRGVGLIASPTRAISRYGGDVARIRQMWKGR
jgi:hypothetical protein